MEEAGKLRKRKGNVTAAITHQRTVAQQRRMLENVEFEKLSAELPIARAISGQHIDKVCLIRCSSIFMMQSLCSIRQHLISSDPRVQSAGTAILNIRMKSTLTKRANKDVMKCSAGYKVIQMETSLIQSVHCNCIVAFCQPLPVLIYTSIRLDSYSFAITADVDLAIHYVDAR
ncbi:unnamed protein product [Anisakis simplex]|uniref:Helix-loop-helix 34 (inferred by orthology to a C. elegans protein) n=1 Tax=Anisakis simplex TaxID=6269 RepID=A0A0M3JXH0_ANISI|nr:unnamed protein product [Anisakis simplex]